jgi:hypothetical protein
VALITLPRPLARWRRQLALFPEDVASAVGKLVRALAPAFDKLSRPAAGDDGEVDGFSGIWNRGSYERLLPSEWALARGLPLEFLRRAASGEQSFYHVARRGPAKKESLLVLFDAGPEQLGASRIVQLAVLVLVSERAEARGEPLYWQLLHHLGEKPFSSLDEHTVRRFIEARTALRSSQKAIESWRSRYGGHELWLVAGPSQAAYAAGLSTFVCLAERVDLEARVVDVRLTSGKRAASELALEIPEPKVAVRLIRDLFSAPRPPAYRLKAPGVSSRLLLNDSGSRLFYRGPEGGLVALTVPSSSRADPGRPRRYEAPARSSVIGAMGRSRKIRWLCMARGLLTLRSTVPLHENLVALTAAGPLLDPGEELWPFAYFPERMLTFVAPDRSLWRVDFASGKARAIAEGVRAFLPNEGSSFAVVERSLDPASDLPSVLELRPYTARRHFYLPEREALEGGAAFLRRSSDSWIIGYESSEGTFRIQDRKKDGNVRSEIILHAPTGASVVGVDPMGNGFYLLDEERRELAFVTRTTSKVLLKTSSPITDVRTAVAGPVIAYLTESREFGVLDGSGRLRLRRTLEGR